MDKQAFQTLKSMLKARGITAEEFETVGNPLDETKMYTFGGVLIIFSEKTRITEKELINNIFPFASENNYTAGMIIVTTTKPSEKVLEVLRTYISNKEHPLAQIFFISHLNFDISQHRKVPKHRIISDDEVQKMMKEFNVKSLSNLPKIDCQDAMAKWIGARPGDVVEVSGICVASGENKRYRYCMSNVYEV